jgi:hypothetical protein
MSQDPALLALDPPRLTGDVEMLPGFMDPAKDVDHEESAEEPATNEPDAALISGEARDAGEPLKRQRSPSEERASKRQALSSSTTAGVGSRTASPLASSRPIAAPLPAFVLPWRLRHEPLLDATAICTHAPEDLVLLWRALGIDAVEHVASRVFPKLSGPYSHDDLACALAGYDSPSEAFCQSLQLRTGAAHWDTGDRITNVKSALRVPAPGPMTVQDVLQQRDLGMSRRIVLYTLLTSTAEIWTDIIHARFVMDSISQLSCSAEDGSPIPMPVISASDSTLPLFSERAWKCLVSDDPSGLTEFRAVHAIHASHLRFLTGDAIARLTPGQRALLYSAVSEILPVWVASDARATYLGRVSALVRAMNCK